MLIVNSYSSIYAEECKATSGFLANAGFSYSFFGPGYDAGIGVLNKHVYYGVVYQQYTEYDILFAGLKSGRAKIVSLLCGLGSLERTGTAVISTGISLNFLSDYWDYDREKKLPKFSIGIPIEIKADARLAGILGGELKMGFDLLRKPIFHGFSGGLCFYFNDCDDFL